MSTEAHPGRTETAGPAPDPRSATSVSDADLAARLVVDAGTLARRLREGGLDVSRKTPIADGVTEADTAAERRITDLLAHHRPGTSVPSSPRTPSSGRWCARRSVMRRSAAVSASVTTSEMVDGTYNFVAGSDY